MHVVKDLEWTKIDLAQKKKTPVFLYHGYEDFCIKHNFAELTYDYLKANGLDHFEFRLDYKVKNYFDGEPC
jgi:predicted esterase